MNSLAKSAQGMQRGPKVKCKFHEKAIKSDVPVKKEASTKKKLSAQLDLKSGQMIWLPSHNATDKGRRRFIKQEKDDSFAADCNNNLNDLKRTSHEEDADVYKFDEEDDGEQHFQAQSKIVKKVKDKTAAVDIVNGAPVRSIASPVQVAVKNEDKGQDVEEGGEESVVEEKPSCRKSARRRPSVLYIEDPFEIILDSDDLEGFDFENGDLFFAREKKKGRRKVAKGSARKRAPKTKMIKVAASHEEEPRKSHSKESQRYKIYSVAPTPIITSPTTPKVNLIPPIPQIPIPQTPQVNPIFLWARQEDTLIVEVKCEDYDKRNRIRLTKKNGSWRAMPRTEINSIAPSPHHSPPIHYGMQSEKKKAKRSKKKRHRRKHKRARLPHPHTSDVKLQSCMVSLVALPELMLQRTQKVEPMSNELIIQEVESKQPVNDKDVDSSSPPHASRGVTMKRKTHVPNASLNDNLKRKHVRFVLENDVEFREGEDDDAEEHDSGVGAASEGDGATHARRLSNREEQQKGYEDEEDVVVLGKSKSRLQKSSSNSSDARAAHRQPEVQVRRLGNASPVVVVTCESPLLLAGKTQRGAGRLAVRRNIPNNNNNQYTERSASPGTLTKQDKIKRQEELLLQVFSAEKKKEQVPIFNSDKVDCTAVFISEEESEGEEEEVTVISVTRNCIANQQQQQPKNTFSLGKSLEGTEKCSKPIETTPLPRREDFIIEDDGDATYENNGRIVHTLEDTLLDEEEEEDDDVTFISCKAAEQLHTDPVEILVRGGVGTSNDGVVVVGGDALTQQQHYHQRILTSEEQLHQSLKATTELIAGIGGFVVSEEIASFDPPLTNSDPTTNRIELLRNRGAESKLSMAANTTLCNDDYDDEILMDAAAPVADIISRLSDSPKCLSFNEMGEIEAMEAFTMSMKEMTEKGQIKDQGMNVDYSCGDDYPRDLTCKTSGHSSATLPTNKEQLNTLPRSVSRGSDAIQSPQPSGLPAIPPSPDIFPNINRCVAKSLFLESILSTPNKSAYSSQSQQQQREPLDLVGTCRKSASPTVTCSEEVSKRRHDEIVDLVSELESSSASSSTSESSRKRIKYETGQNVAVIEKDNESNSKAIREEATRNRKRDSTDNLGSSKPTPEGYLMDILNTNAKDPDPLTQLRLLISNTEWKVPETLLVPKDRLNAVLASPAREIPLLLTTRPELRLPGAFAFPAILQDPDILVVSLAQLEAILEKQQEILKLKSNERTTSSSTGNASEKAASNQNLGNHSQGKSERHQESLMQEQIQRTINNKSLSSQKSANPNRKQSQQLQGQELLNPNLAGDIDAATIAAFNQMLWLPYINQMRGQLTPELLKAVAGFSEMIPLLAAQSRLQQGPMSSPQNDHNQNNNPGGGNAFSSLNNSMEFALWQESMNNANLRAILKGQSAANDRHSNSSQANRNVELAKIRMEQQRKPGVTSTTASNSFLAPGKIPKQQQQDNNQQQFTNPLSPLSIPPFVPPAASQNTSRYFNPLFAAANIPTQNYRSSMPSPINQLNTLHSPFSPNYNLRQQSHQQAQQQGPVSQKASQRFNAFGSSGGVSTANREQGKKGSIIVPPNQFYQFGGANPLEFDEQLNLLATKKAQKELEQVLQFQQRLQSQQNKFSQEEKSAKMNLFSSPQQQQLHMNQFLNSAKMSLHHHQQQQQQHLFNQQMMTQLNELSKLSSLMTMPSAFDSPQNNPGVNHTGAGGHDQQQQQQQLQNSSHDHCGQHPKLKVKPGLHLLDPLAMQRRLLASNTESSDNESSPDLNSPLWHPLFGNSGQKVSSGGGTYTSPWQWTTVTTAGE